MAMYLPKPTETDFELPPPGTFLAVCYRVLDLGTQDTTYKGTPKRQHKILISWELPEEKMKDGRPFTISQRYTWSMSEKATLRKNLESWRGEPFAEKDFGQGGFDIKNILGKGCLLTIVHTNKGDKNYANIASISRIMKGMTVPAAANEKVFLGLNNDDFDQPVFFKLSDNLQNTIKASPEYQEMVNGYSGPAEGPVADAKDFHDDEIPF